MLGSDRRTEETSKVKLVGTTHLFSIPIQLSCKLELINIEPPSPPLLLSLQKPPHSISFLVENVFIISRRPANTHDHLLSIY